MHRSYLTEVIIVGLGGFVGSSARFALSGLTHRLLSQGTFPYGTLAVNLVGCLAIGFLGGLIELRQVVGPGQRLFLMIGVLGGFTTYSSFAYETLSLVHASDMLKAAGNVVVHVAFCLAAAWLGYAGAQQL